MDGELQLNTTVDFDPVFLRHSWIRKAKTKKSKVIKGLEFLRMVLINEFFRHLNYSSVVGEDTCRISIFVPGHYDSMQTVADSAIAPRHHSITSEYNKGRWRESNRNPAAILQSYLQTINVALLIYAYESQVCMSKHTKICLIQLRSLVFIHSNVVHC